VRRWLITPALVTVLAVAACGKDRGLSPAPPPTDQQRSPFFGINGDVVFVFLIQGMKPLADRHLAQIAAAPISYVRAGIDWRRIQPAPPKHGKNRYDFWGHDVWVEALASKGLRWAPNLLPIPIPGWAADLEKAHAGCGSRAPPKGIRPYVELVSAIAKRYGRDGSFWKEHPDLPELPVIAYEIWNEPNHWAFWCPRPDPEAFAEIALAASRAIRAADRNAKVVLGGLAPYIRNEPPGRPRQMAVDSFVNATVAAQPELPDYVDAVAIHLYGDDPETIIGTARRFRNSLDEAGFKGTPLVVNELGWPRQGSGGLRAISDEDARGQILSTLIEALYGTRQPLDIESVAPYSWITEQMDPRNQQQWFGLADPRTAQPYAAGNAYRDLVERLSSDR
jgi:hypothetical protein